MADAAALQRALQRLCGDYEELADEAGELARPVDERAGLALFKIDEAAAAAGRLRADAEQAQAQILDALVANALELEDIYLRINLVERFVNRMLETTRQLERRAEAVARAADPVFNAGSVANVLMRSFSLKRSAPAATAQPVKWEPVTFDFSTSELLERLQKSDARELGVSISAEASATAAASAVAQPPPAPMEVSDSDSDE